MAEKTPPRKTAHGKGKRLFILIASCLLLATGALYFLLQLTLASRFAAESISKLLSDSTGYRINVSRANLSGDTLTFERVSIRNPQGFSRQELITVRSVSLSPDWIGLLAGKRSLSSLELDGMLLGLEKNQSGEWNFSGLVSRLMKKKRKPAAEISISHLAIRDLSLSINGRRSGSFGLNIKDLSTKGSAESRLVLSAKDPAGNPVQLTAQGRMGPKPSVRLHLAAPHLSLASMQLHGKVDHTVVLDHATAGILFTAELRDSVAAGRFTGSFDRIGLRTGGKTTPLKADIDVSIRYDALKDEAWIDPGILMFHNTPSIRFSGSMSRVRRDTHFEFRISPFSIPIVSISSLLSENRLQGITLGGTLSSKGLTIQGDSVSGITSGKMKFSIRDGAAAGNGRLFLEKVSADIALTGGGDGWSLNGRVYSAAKTAAPLIRSLNAPFAASFSPRMKPVRLDIPSLTAHIAGAGLNGDMHYLRTASKPWSAALTVKATDLAELNGYLAKTSPRIASGKGSLAARFSGSSLRNCEGRVTADTRSLSVTTSERKISLGQGTVISRVRGGPSGFFADGGLKLSTAIVDGKKWDMRADYSVGNGRFTFRNCDLRGDKTRLRLSSATMSLPPRPGVKADGNIPLVGTVTGLDVRYGTLSATGVSGRFDCRYYDVASDMQLHGTADLQIDSLAIKDRKTASLSGRAVFSGKEASANLRGTSLGGAIEGTVHARPFSIDRSLSFSLRSHDQRIEELAGLFPPRQSFRLSGGLLNADLEGTVDRKAGLRLKLSAAGRTISLKNPGGKEIISGVGLKLLSTVSGGDLTLQEAVCSRGPEITARFSGSVKRFASGDRKGSFSYSLDATRLNSLLDAFANALPGPLQEAEGQGTLAIGGSADLNGKGVATSGDMTIAAASLEIPSRKVSVTGIDGRVPFSFVFPGLGQGRAAPSVSFSRENYQVLLSDFRKTVAKGTPLRIGAIRFGPLETGKIEAYVSAGGGSMEIAPMNISLYGGTLMGKGFLRYNNGLEYEGDFLLNNLSLKQFCASFQRIQGYMSGRVDGVISLYHGNGTVRGLNGFANLWARSGNGEKMLVSKEFLQKLSGKKLKGFFFTNDRSYDNGEISAYLLGDFITFEKLDISHTNILGMRDLSVTVVPVQNRISMQHLLESIREAAARGKGGGAGEPQPPVQTDLKWLE